MKRKSERLITYQKIEAFGQWLESCERSMETVKKYRHYLKQFKRIYRRRAGYKGDGTFMESKPEGTYHPGYH